MKSQWSVSLTVLVLLAGSVATAATASAVAQPGGSSTGGFRSSAAAHSDATGMGWSGYMATGKTFTSVSASWIQPKVKCVDNGDVESNFYVGIGNNPVTEIGTSAVCDATEDPQYSAQEHIYPYAPSAFSKQVYPGDKLTGSVTNTGGDNFALKLTDTTQGWTVTDNETADPSTQPGGDRNSAQAVVEPTPAAKSGFRALSNFGKVNFTNVTVDGAPLADTNPTKLTETPCTVSSLNGGSFSLTWNGY